MNNLPSPKRRFWQIHLSTALVLTFVASILLWANVRPKRPELIIDGDGQYHHFLPHHGWPFHGQYVHSSVDPISEEDQRKDREQAFENDTLGESDLFNAAIAISVLAAVCLGAELFTRRIRPPRR